MKQTALPRRFAPCTSCRVLKSIREAILKRGFWVLIILLLYCGACQLKDLVFLGMYQEDLPNFTVNHLMCGVPGTLSLSLWWSCSVPVWHVYWTKCFSFTYALPKHLLIGLFLVLFYSQMQTYMLNMCPVLRTVLQHTKKDLKLIRR